MNLEDYAYNEDDRWYVNPQVSLDEQNAFINNLRNLQAQDNAQITQQTRGLGTQVPSNLGGLVGGGSYFRSRYQTPQTNKTIADLRAVAQNQALQTALNNELEKAKKKYRDSQNNALKKNGLNDVPLTVTDAGGEGDKYKTEYVNTETKDKPFSVSYGGGLNREKELMKEGHTQQESREIMFEENKRPRVGETYDQWEARLRSMGVDEDEIRSLMNSGMAQFDSEEDRATVERIKETLGW